MTKKILSILMVCALAVCMCIPAFAAEPATYAIGNEYLSSSGNWKPLKIYNNQNTASYLTISGNTVTTTSSSRASQFYLYKGADAITTIRPTSDVMKAIGRGNNNGCFVFDIPTIALNDIQLVEPSSSSEVKIQLNDKKAGISRYKLNRKSNNGVNWSTDSSATWTFVRQ